MAMALTVCAVRAGVCSFQFHSTSMLDKQIIPSSVSKVKARLKIAYRLAQQRWIDAFLSFGPDELKVKLGTLGVSAGDTLVVQSSFGPASGFRGSAAALIDAFLGVLGPRGNLVMVTLPYGGSTLEYLQRGQAFDVRRTPSQMGLISEVFRRRAGVARSLHPTHPVAALGPEAEWLTDGHEKCQHAFGTGSPYEKLVDLKAKVVLFNVPFAVIIFFHYLEHLAQDRLDFPLYGAEVFEVPVIDRAGEHSIVKTVAYSPEALRRRRRDILENEMARRGSLRRAKLGNSVIVLLNTSDLMECHAEMTRGNVLFYDPA